MWLSARILQSSLDSLPDQSGNGLPENAAISGPGRNPIKPSIDQELAALPKMDRRGRLALWEQLFGKPPNPAIRLEVMVPVLAYRLQEKAYGGLKPSVARQLRALIGDDSNGRKPARLSSMRTKPGTRIVREWNGKLHEVTVLPDGYEYNGQTYRSLSVIARTITGTRWSGPAFFGIRRRQRKADAK
jgi:hypothetical protein